MIAWRDRLVFSIVLLASGRSPLGSALAGDWHSDMATEWFRRLSWGPADQAAFNAKLNRARPGNRSQYLRIQALHLAEAELHRDALTLLDRLVADYPDRMQLAQAHQQRGDSLLSLGSADAALDAYWAAIDAQRASPNVRTSAPLDYAFTVACLERQALFDRALSVLDEFEAEDGGIAFPTQQFLQSAARALIGYARSRPEASGFAARALQAAGAAHSRIARHPTVGLVDHIDRSILARLRRVAAS